MIFHDIPGTLSSYVIRLHGLQIVEELSKGRSREQDVSQIRGRANRKLPVDDSSSYGVIWKHKDVLKLETF